MCGRYAVFTEEENQEMREIINEVNEHFKDQAVKMKTGEIFPTDTVPVIAANAENKRTAKLFKWGFPNFKQPGSVIINARSETIQEKPTFNRLIHNNRCLVPASGFYEWKTIGSKKEKYLIRTSEYNFFYMAGLYNSCVDKNGNRYTGFVIITTDANEQMASIHSRMPVIFDKAQAEAWLFKGFEDLKQANSILIPSRKRLEFYKVS